MQATTCHYCDAPATTVDHVIPQAFGGPDSDDNKVPACHSCNSSKGTLPLEVWQLSNRERTAWLKDHGWKRLGGNSWSSPDPSDRSFYSTAAALRHEGFVRSNISAGRTTNLRLPRTHPNPHFDGFIGRWFHSWEEADDPELDKFSSGLRPGLRVVWQGRITARADADSYFVQLYSWWDGEPHQGQTLASRGEMAGWTYYDNAQEMQLALGCSEEFPNGKCRRAATHRTELGNYVCERCAKFYSEAKRVT